MAALPGKIALHGADGGFTSDGLVTVLKGSNAIVAQFKRYPGVAEGVLLRGAAGRDLVRVS